MKLIKGFFIAFGMYSAVPVPKTVWDEEGMKYALCFFPAVGMVEGAVFFLLWNLGSVCQLPKLMLGALLTALPVLITGGIHMDGFLDTLDARGSRRSREERLAILKDSHTGAFAVMGGALYFILYFAAASSLTDHRQVFLFEISFILCRALSGLSLVCLKGARQDGLMYTFASGAHKRNTRLCLAFILAVCAAAMMLIHPISGSAALLAALAVFLYYIAVSYREFGGITGDLAGFFLQLGELAVLYAIVIVNGMVL